jgi:putative acetyltransferase
MAALVIRNENELDYTAIRDITFAAFEHHPYSRQTEHLLVEAMRAAGIMTISLVAEQNGEVIGHIAFSPVQIEGKFLNWYGLGPVSVRPDKQQKGIGKALILKGLELLKEMGAEGCVLLGDAGYYRRFGFAQDNRLQLEGFPTEHFLALPFGENVPAGKVEFHQVFTDFG